MTISRIYQNWAHCIPVDGSSFRVSAKLWTGKNKTLKYRYITFTKPEQFKAWLKMNQSKLYEIVTVGI